MTDTTTVEEWSVFQRGDSGAWVLRFKDPNTCKWRDKRIPSVAGVRTKKAAEAWATEWLAQQALPVEPIIERRRVLIMGESRCSRVISRIWSNGNGDRNAAQVDDGFHAQARAET